jgi:hypothetical protein
MPDRVGAVVEKPLAYERHQHVLQTEMLSSKLVQSRPALGDVPSPNKNASNAVAPVVLT